MRDLTILHVLSLFLEHLHRSHMALPMPSSQQDDPLVVAVATMTWRRHDRRWRCRLRSPTPDRFGPHDVILSEDEPSTAQSGDIDCQTL